MVSALGGPSRLGNSMVMQPQSAKLTPKPITAHIRPHGNFMLMRYSLSCVPHCRGAPDMHHSDSFDRSDSNFRSMAVAGVGAVAVVVLLAALTAVVWSLGSGSSQTTALEVSAPQTPTPRALSFRTTNE